MQSRNQWIYGAQHKTPIWNRKKGMKNQVESFDFSRNFDIFLHICFLKNHVNGENGCGGEHLYQKMAAGCCDGCMF
jgi:hypothetical protein